MNWSDGLCIARRSGNLLIDRYRNPARISPKGSLCKFLYELLPVARVPTLPVASYIYS